MVNVSAGELIEKTQKYRGEAIDLQSDLEVLSTATLADDAGTLVQLLKGTNTGIDKQIAILVKTCLDALEGAATSMQTICDELGKYKA